MKMSGIYKFYQNGELIGEAENSMTEIGRILSVKTLMGAIPNFATSLGIGVSSTANGAATNNLIPDYKLGLKVATCPVIGSNIDSDTTYDAILFKGRISDPLYYRIHEVGLFSDPLLSGSTGYKQELILGFENADNFYNSSLSQYLNEDDYTNTTYRMVDRTDVTYGTQFRTGRKALLLGGTQQIYTENSFNGLDQYDETDEIILGFYASAVGRNVDVTFYSGGGTGTYRTYRFTSTAIGYNVITKQISSTPQASAGTLDWSNITRVGVASSAATVILDALRFENVNQLDTNRGMISRAVLPTPIVKLANIPIDIEYTLRIGFGG
jgi:hypothetical protein